MAQDLFHDLVKRALEKEGWVITDDPLILRVGLSNLFVDFAAEKVILAERGVQKIAVEVKSFLNRSTFDDFHHALGQYIK